MSILIVDDQETERMRLARLCAKSGLKAGFAGASALTDTQDALRQGQVDIVFLDYHLDMETGLDLLAWLRADRAHRDCPVVMVTSVSSPALMVEATRLGSGYMNKDDMTTASVATALIAASERQVLTAIATDDLDRRTALLQSVARFIRSSTPAMLAGLQAALERPDSLRDLSASASDDPDILHRVKAHCPALFVQIADALARLPCNQQPTRATAVQSGTPVPGISES